MASTPRGKSTGLFAKLGSLLPKKAARCDSLTEGLDRLNNRLGICTSSEDNKKPHPLEFTVESTAGNPRAIIYAPDMDGQVDPGEVVWFWAPAHATPHVAPRTAAANEAIERAMVVVARHHDDVLGLLLSTNIEHSDDSHWLDVGAGPWDETGQQAWVRLDRTIRIPESAIRRQGAVMPQGRFERISIRLRREFGWV